MPRETQIISFSVPPEMGKKIKRLMKKENRTRSELSLRFWQDPLNFRTLASLILDHKNKRAIIRLEANNERG